MKAIASEGEDKINRLSRVWVHGSGYEVDDDTLPFLFINGGAATLSTSARGTAILRDTATRRKLQLLEHTGTCYSQSYAAVPNRYISAPRSPHFCYGTSALVLLWDASVLTFPLSAKAYHISTRMYTIATTDYGRNATIKVWTAKRPSLHPQGRVSGSFGLRRLEY